MKRDINKSYWRALESIRNRDNKNLVNIFQTNAMLVEATMYERTPYEYGGLLASKYVIVTTMGNNISLRMGYANRRHYNLDPAEPGVDDITNPDLMRYLEHTKREKRVKDIKHAMSTCIRNLKLNIAVDFTQQQLEQARLNRDTKRR